MPKLSIGSRRVMNALGTSRHAPKVERRLLKLERQLTRHRTASISLVVANERAGANNDQVNWSDVDTATEFAVKALGKSHVAKIRQQMRGEAGEEIDDEDEDNE